MESDIPVDSSLAENANIELNSQEPHLRSVGTFLEAHDYRNQVLYDENGQAFNLSSVNWSYVTYFYDYDADDNNNNINNISASYSELVVPPERAIAAAVFILMFVVGVVANSMVVYKAVRHRAGRRGANLYFLNISLADVFYLLMCLPTIGVSYGLVDWRLGDTFCKLENYFISVTMSVNALIILSAGLHQYLIIKYPDQSGSFKTTKARLYILCSVWIMSFALMTPRILIFSQTPAYLLRGLVTVCERNTAVGIRRIDAGLMFFVLYLLPLLVLLICCCMVGRHLWRTRFQGFQSTSPLKKTDVRPKRRNAKIIFAMTAVFAIGWFPLHFYQLVEDFDYGNILFGEYFDRGTVALFISFGSKMFNPIFFCLFNGSLKGYVCKTFTCKKLRVCSADHTPCTVSASPMKAEEMWPRSVIHSLPVSLLSDMWPSRDEKLTPSGGFTLEKGPTFPHLQPLLKSPGFE